MMTVLAVVIGALGVAWYVLPHLLKKAQINLLREHCRDGRRIVLTYDDGPGRRVTHALLSMLHERQAKATFFVLGRKVAAEEAGVVQLLSEGHEFGSHSYRHLHAWKRDPVSVLLDIKKGLRTVRAMAECRLFRAPYGKITLGSVIQLWLQGCRQSWWTIDSTDTWDRLREIEEILDQVRREGGGVVLMHDMDRPDRPDREQFVLDLTRALLDLAQNEGFRICKLGEVIR